MKKFDKHKALGKTAQKGVVWGFLRESVSELLLFPASMVLARILTPREFGVAAASAFFMQLAGRTFDFGFNQTLVKAKDLQPIHMSTIFAIQLTVGVFAFLLMVTLSPWIGAFYNMPEATHVLPVAAIAFLIGPWGSTPAALLQRNFEYKKATTIDWIQLTVMAGSNIVLALLGFSYMSIIYSRLAGSIATQIARYYFTRHRPSVRFSWEALKELLPTSTGFFSKRLLDYFAQNGDNLVVGKVQGLTALGLYDKAYSTMNRFLVRMNTAGPGVMFRIFAVIHEEPERFRRAYTNVIMSASMLGFPIFTTLAVMAPQVIVVMFGPRWLPAATPFAFLCFSGALKLLNSYVSAATQAAGLIWSEVWRQLLFVAMIVGFIYAFTGWGTAGAAMGVLLATAVMTVLMHALLQRVTHVSWIEIARPLMPAVVCAFGVAAVVTMVGYGIAAVIPQPSPWLLVFCQLPVAGLFIAGFALFAPFRDLRDLVLEMTDTLAPPVVKQHRWMQAYLRAHAESVDSTAVV